MMTEPKEITDIEDHLRRIDEQLVDAHKQLAITCPNHLPGSRVCPQFLGGCPWGNAIQNLTAIYEAKLTKLKRVRALLSGTRLPREKERGS